MPANTIFLDYNSTTPVDEKVLERMLPYFNRFFGNASSKTHAFGWEAEAAVERAREEVAAFINVEPRELIFTSGATEAINIALYGLMHAYRSKGNHIISAATEHKAVLDTLKGLEHEGFNVTLLGTDREGLISLEELAQSITPQTTAVCIMVANNETGTIQPSAEIGKICKERNVLFFCDATQAAGKMMLDVQELQCDLLCLSAHKIYGPKGVGALYIRRRSPMVRLTPLLTGGGHEKGLRPGTLNVPGIVGLGAACSLASDFLWDEAARLSALRTRLEQKLEKSISLTLNGSIKNRLCNTTNIAFHGIRASELIAALPKLAFSTGSACTSALPEPSHVLQAMGISNSHIASSVRFSLGRYTTMAEVDAATEQIRSAVDSLAGHTRAL